MNEPKKTVSALTPARESALRKLCFGRDVYHNMSSIDLEECLLLIDKLRAELEIFKDECSRLALKNLGG